MTSRSWEVLVWICIGALASGLSMGWVLHRANADRGALLSNLKAINTHVQSLEKLNQALGDSMKDTAQELGRIQSELDHLKSWQSVLKNATPLIPPAPSRLKGWAEFASVPMGVSIRVPVGSKAQTNDDGLFLRTQPKAGSSGVEEQWLVLVKYRPELETDFYKNTHTQSSEPVSYSLDNRLLDGMRGTFSDNSDTSHILTVQENASSTYLIWAKTVPGISERTILDTIATLSFR